jgi:tetratricopeptide (TPR) repeat protein
LRRAFEWLLEGEDQEKVTLMATCIDRFLEYFGLRQEQQLVHQLVAEALKTRKPSVAGALTLAEYQHELSLGDEEMDNGQLQAAYARFLRLLARIESQSEGNSPSSDSFEHVSILGRLGRCLQISGNLSSAEQIYRRTMVLSDLLLQRDPERQDLLRQRSTLWADLGDVLLSQGQYAEAKQFHKQALQISREIGNQRDQALSQGQLGAIALEEREYPEARMRYQQALSTFHALGELAMEAIVWHQLGLVAQQEQNWPEAEHCYRKCLSLKDQLGDRVGAARTCNNLGKIAESTNRFEEAKGWYQQAVRIAREADPTGGDYAMYLSNLANCLIQEVKKEKLQNVSLQMEEAREHAEQSLAIKQVLGDPGLWYTFSILATIAEMQGRHEERCAYRRKERDAYASFGGNRYQIDRLFGGLFLGFAEALNNLEFRALVEETFPQLEASGLHISGALRRIWAGERDWHTLAENLSNQDALVVRRVLETLGEGLDTTTNECSSE